MGNAEEARASSGGPAPDRDFGQTHGDLELWRAGDRTAGDRILQRYEPALEVLVRRRIRALGNAAVQSRLSAEDILQDALVTVTRKRHEFEFRGPGSLFGWMLTIADNQVRDRVDYWETHKRTPNREQSLPAGAGDTQAPAADPADGSAGPRTRAEHRERASRVAIALVELPDREFRIVMLRYFFGAEWDEIARDVGSPSGEAVRKEHAKSLPALAPKLKGLQ